MTKIKRLTSYRAGIMFLTCGGLLWPPCWAYAQLAGTMGGYSGGGTESADSENSKIPFTVKLKGVLNPSAPSPTSLAVLEMTIGNFTEHYRFEVQTIEIPDYPEASTNQLLQSLRKYKVQLAAIGDKQTLTKIGQSFPDSPLSVTGLFTRRYRTFQVIDMEVFRMDDHPKNSRETKGEPQDPRSQEAP